MNKPFFIQENVTLGGLLQAVQIWGTDPENPLLLVIHGGPGCSEMSSGFRDHEPWTKRYTVVNWDQRCVGATALLSGSTPDGEIRLDDIVEDAHELALYVLKKFKKEKLVVLGHSWGSIVGSQVTYRYPELFYGFIGWGQVVNMVTNEKVSIAHTLEVAAERGDQKTIEQLNALMPYPDPLDPPETTLQKLMTSTVIKYSYGYGSVKHPDIEDFNQYLKGLAKENPYYPDEAIPYMNNDVAYISVITKDLFVFDLLEYSPRYEIPVLFVFGDNDWQTPFPPAQEYLEKLEAPYKSFHFIKDSGHSTTLDNNEDFTDFLIHTAYDALIESR